MSEQYRFQNARCNNKKSLICYAYNKDDNNYNNHDHVKIYYLHGGTKALLSATPTVQET
jgi:hypothetical protein